MMRGLKQFMRRVGARGRDVARATGLTECMVSRLKDGKIQNPRWDTVLRITDWADREAARLRLKPRERLQWAPYTAKRPLRRKVG